MEELKKKVEALLFSSARSMSLEELTRLCRAGEEEIRRILEELQKEYSEKASSLAVVQDRDMWKLTTKEEYLNLVKNIVTKTELSKTLMETLAVVAFKYPMKQSDLIKIRTNKAYDHLKELEELGYITRQKYGRTKLIKLSQKFFDYFSLPPDKLKEQFKDFEDLAVAIEKKENEIKEIKKEQKKKAAEVDLVKDDGEKVKLEIFDDAVEQKNEEPIQKIEPYSETLGDLEVVDEAKIKAKKIKKTETKEDKPEEPIRVDNDVDEKVEKRVNEILGLQLSEAEPEVSPVDQKVEEWLHPKEEKPEPLHQIDESKWGQSSEKKDILYKKDTKEGKVQ